MLLATPIVISSSNISECGILFSSRANNNILNSYVQCLIEVVHIQGIWNASDIFTTDNRRQRRLLFLSMSWYHHGSPTPSLFIDIPPKHLHIELEIINAMILIIYSSFFPARVASSCNGQGFPNTFKKVNTHTMYSTYRMRQQQQQQQTIDFNLQPQTRVPSSLYVSSHIFSWQF